MKSLFVAGNCGAGSRFYRHYLTVGKSFLQTAGGTCKCARRADSAYKHIHSVQLRYYFFTRGQIVRKSVCLVVKLPQTYSVGLLRKIFGKVNGTLHAKFALRQHQLRPQALQKVAPFHAHRVGHCQQHPVTTAHAYICKGNAHVSAGRFHNCTALVQKTFFLRIQNHCQRSPVLNAAAGIHGFVFDVDVGVKIFLVRYERGVADTEFLRFLFEIHLKTSFIYVANDKNTVGTFFTHRI